ncbi:hypothetical protein [Thermococcus sp. JCM 11816]|uniref:hypothetical protein n=1 Tax=Thermococcus sp. (strain JCM 11816 / KS-1) TaxID=1295125 RepID=UPI0006D05A8E
MKLYGTEVSFITFLRFWVSELVLALLGGYFGSNGFYPEALLMTGGVFWLSFSAITWLACMEYKRSKNCSLEAKMGAIFFAIIPASNVLAWIFGFYPYSTLIISLLWTLLVFKVGIKLGAREFLRIVQEEE